MVRLVLGSFLVGFLVISLASAQVKKDSDAASAAALKKLGGVISRLTGSNGS